MLIWVLGEHLQMHGNVKIQAFSIGFTSISVFPCRHAEMQKCLFSIRFTSIFDVQSCIPSAGGLLRNACFLLVLQAYLAGPVRPLRAVANAWNACFLLVLQAYLCAFCGCSSSQKCLILIGFTSICWKCAFLVASSEMLDFDWFYKHLRNPLVRPFPLSQNACFLLGLQAFQAFPIQHMRKAGMLVMVMVFKHFPVCLVRFAECGKCLFW